MEYTNAPSARQPSIENLRSGHPIVAGLSFICLALESGRRMKVQLSDSREMGMARSSQGNGVVPDVTPQETYSLTRSVPVGAARHLILNQSQACHHIPAARRAAGLFYAPTYVICYVTLGNVLPAMQWVLPNSVIVAKSPHNGNASRQITNPDGVAVRFAETPYLVENTTANGLVMRDSVGLAKLMLKPNATAGGKSPRPFYVVSGAKRGTASDKLSFQMALSIQTAGLEHSSAGRFAIDCMIVACTNVKNHVTLKTSKFHHVLAQLVKSLDALVTAHPYQKFSTTLGQAVLTQFPIALKSVPNCCVAGTIVARSAIKVPVYHV